jgi:hypothetical protein
MNSDLCDVMAEDICRGKRPKNEMAPGTYKVFRRTGEGKGRPGVTRPGRPQKLDAIKVVDMRLQRNAGTSYAELGRRFGVSLDLARRVCLRIKWAHVA